MPPELMELYNLYQMEIETRESNEKDQNLLVEAEKILRVSGLRIINVKMYDAIVDLSGILAACLKVSRTRHRD